MKSFKVVVIGTSNVGKTSILNRINSNGFEDDLPVTTNTSVITKDCAVDNYSFTINYWDTAGQEKYKALAEHYYQGAKYAIAVFKINDQSSFDEMLDYILTFRQKCDLISESDDNSHPNIIIAANMTDLIDDSTELIAQYQKQIFVKHEENTPNYGVSCILPTSAKTNTGIDDLQAQLQHLIIQDYLIPNEAKEDKNDDDGTGIVISEPLQTTEQKGCC